MLEAIEAKDAIHACINLLERKFSEGGRKIPGLKHGAIWQKRLGVWGHFSESGRKTPPDRYWNVFGQQPARLRQNMLVEINPPGSGKNLNRQGVLASDARGQRWLLHQGRLHPRGVRITEDMFDIVAKSKRDRVRYSDGTVALCHRVANLDRPPVEVQEAVAAFIELCARVRVHFQLGAEARDMFERVSKAEGASSPERQGGYDLPPIAGGTAERRHADIWHALTQGLDALKIPHSNSRFGRYGPDLFAQAGSGRLLFEIKSAATASDLQQALGQLNLYEQLGGQPCKKIMVLPESPPPYIAKALTDLGIHILYFERQGASVRFSQQSLRKLATDGVIARRKRTTA
ncbi:hypothetical protein ELG69_29080 [Rhizobium leguminosarum]|uniref:hypothetical protein n=1 Tax=Rhizobium leguminosarum TaxID=384 RepID=UPI001031172E|nr:hypothetical protein [Rhizobium leguminosarum]TBG74397.1 hypothetical protein ELG69_29080 [Rhizobium leguminosarum]